LVWVNGHCLGRFWNIGPTQTMYLPAPWLHKGRNEVVVLDYIGPQKNLLAGLSKPQLNELKDKSIGTKHRIGNQVLQLGDAKPVAEGSLGQALNGRPNYFRFQRAVIFAWKH